MILAMLLCITSGWYADIGVALAHLFTLGDPAVRIAFIELGDNDDPHAVDVRNIAVGNCGIAPNAGRDLYGGAAPGQLNANLAAAVASDARVINLSLTNWDDPAQRATVAAGVAADKILVAAAGNDGLPHYPAQYPGVISVAACCYYVPGGESSPGIITAPALFTSDAAPEVAGTVALMLALNPRLTLADVRRILLDTRHGGILHAGDAVRAVWQDLGHAWWPVFLPMVGMGRAKVGPD